MKILKLTGNNKSRAQKALLVFIIFFEFSSYAIAQTEFAPIGSKWHYGYMKDTEKIMQEYFTYESVKDTLIEGKTCKKLDIWYFNKYKKSIYWGFDILFSDSGRVFYYYKNIFNLLYDFNLKKGDSLKLLLYNPNIPYLKELPDTHYVKYIIWENGSVLINNQNIRYYDIRLAAEDSLVFRNMQLFFQGRIYEKIGDSNFLYGWLIPEGPYHFYSYLRCYSDNDFQYKLNKNMSCDTIITGIYNNKYEKNDILLYPNPASEHCYLKLNSNKSYNKTDFKIIDILGHEYKFDFEKINDRTYSFDISELHAGSYFLIISEQKPIYQKLLKL